MEERLLLEVTAGDVTVGDVTDEPPVNVVSSGVDPNCFHQPHLNDFMAQGRPAWVATRETLQRLLSDQDPTLRDDGGE